MAATNLPYRSSTNAVIDVIFNKYCSDKVQGLTTIELQDLYQSIRPDGLSIKHIEASLRMVCELEQCDEEDLVYVLREMDRRYFLVNDLKWEFVVLDREKKGAITQQDAKFLFKMVHGEFFSQRRWNKFLNARAAKESLISFSEIEVDLCEIPTMGWIEEVLEEEEEERRVREIEREEEENARRIAEEKERKEVEDRRQKEEADRKRVKQAKLKKEEERKKKRQLEEEKRKQEEEEKRKAEQELKEKLDEEERIRELQRMEEEKRKEEEERKEMEKEEERKKQEALLNWKKAELLAKQEKDKERMKKIQEAELQRQMEESAHAEDIAEDAAANEERAQEAARKAAEEARLAQDEESKQRAKEAEKRALAEARQNKEKKLRMQLRAATNSRKTEKIKGAIKDAKEAKMPELQKDIEDAETVLDTIVAGERLKDAMARRHLGDVEAAVNNIKKKKLEKKYAVELIDADRLMNKLRRLERLRQEILELNQSTISEIRSYQKPPEAVHQVMISVYLLLGYKEKELKVWKNMQAFLGRTGKEGLKRQVTTLEPSKVNINTANYVEKVYLSKSDLDSIRDVSAGAATFFVWATSMIEEARAYVEEEEKRKISEAQKKKDEEEERKKEQDRKKAREERRKMGLDVDESSSKDSVMENIQKAAENIGLEAALQSNKNKETSKIKPKPGASPAGKSGTPNSSQLTRGRTNVRSDAANRDRAKSQPSAKKPSNANTGSRSSTPGRK